MRFSSPGYLHVQLVLGSAILLLHPLVAWAAPLNADQTPPTGTSPGYSSDSSSNPESSSSLSTPSYPYSPGLVPGMIPTSNADIVDVARVWSMPRGFANLLFPADRGSKTPKKSNDSEKSKSQGGKSTKAGKEKPKAQEASKSTKARKEKPGTKSAKAPAKKTTTTEKKPKPAISEYAHEDREHTPDILSGVEPLTGLFFNKPPSITFSNFGPPVSDEIANTAENLVRDMVEPLLHLYGYDPDTELEFSDKFAGTWEQTGTIDFLLMCYANDAKYTYRGQSGSESELKGPNWSWKDGKISVRVKKS
ncbi:hypothetical protein F5050DRAFT_749633 [Lentinula boryana]|uniref:Uncharacterized protein n=1 Tax=Lentinula boryana TaxID=40481 RepID=A0ABQ8Q3J3_9AGAR|nr:hypothetical protein F5050DRAFT_749633 [Lentinula boryana]